MVAGVAKGGDSDRAAVRRLVSQVGSTVDRRGPGSGGPNDLLSVAALGDPGRRS